VWWFLFGAARPETTVPPDPGYRISRPAHVVMAAAMIAMTWTTGPT
jgi:hypothetical protein